MSKNVEAPTPVAPPVVISGKCIICGHENQNYYYGGEQPPAIGAFLDMYCTYCRQMQPHSYLTKKELTY